MKDFTGYRDLVLVVSLAFIGLTMVSGYSINTLSEPYNPGNVSNLSDTVRMVNLTDNSEPVTESDLGDAFYFNYTYNKTGGENLSMQHITEGYWYADIKPNTSAGDKIEYVLKEKTGTQDEFKNTETLNFGNYSIEPLTAISDELTPGESMNVRVNVTDEWNSNGETAAEVDIYFTNGTNILKIQDLGNRDGSEYYNSQVDVPDVYGGNYVLHINASSSSDSINNPEGAWSKAVKTEPPIRGEIETLSANSGCNNNSFFQECERGTVIDTSYNVTESVPESVNLTINLWNESSSTWVNHSEIAMANNSIYEAEITVPDVNTSKYGDKIQLLFNASNSESSAIKRYNISLKSYKIRFGASSSSNQGGNYNLDVAFEKYFSAQPLDSTRMDADINITNSTQVLEQFDLSSMEYNNGVFERAVQIGSDWKEGTYTVEVEAENIYGENKSATDNFYVEDVNRTFDITDDIDQEITSTGEHEFEFSVENRMDSEITLDAEPQGEISDIATVNEGDSITIGANEEEDINVVFDIQDFENHDGSISLEDQGGFNESVNVELDIPDCDVEEGDLCVNGDTELTRYSTDSRSETLDLYYLGDDEQSVDMNVTGNVSSILTLEPETYDFDSSDVHAEVTANFSTDSMEYFSGELEVGEITLPLSLKTVQTDSSSEPEEDEQTATGETSIDVTPTLDLGTVAETDRLSREVRVENTGSAEIESINFNSEMMSVSASPASIPAGETRVFQIQISSVTREGIITVTAESDDSTAIAEIEVMGEVVPDYSDRADELSSVIEQLQQRVDSTENQNKLNTASNNVSEMENAYQAGNYQRAESIYRATESELTQIERSSATDTSDTETRQVQNNNTNQQNDGNILLIIGAVVLVLLLIGFIFVESYIPEEGDPLYSVLGR